MVPLFQSIKIIVTMLMPTVSIVVMVRDDLLLILLLHLLILVLIIDFVGTHSGIPVLLCEKYQIKTLPLMFKIKVPGLVH